MPPYRPLCDKLGRVYARCIECQKLYTTDIPWSLMELEVRRQAFTDMRNFFSRKQDVLAEINKELASLETRQRRGV